MEPRFARLRRLWPDRKGVGAVEFAMVIPFMLMLYVGASELTIGITADRKVNNAASTVSDLVGQQSDVTRDRLQAIVGISNALIHPFDATNLRITVTSVGIDANRRATVDWSTDAARYPKGRSFAGLPAGVANQADRHIIVTESRYRYRPVIGFGVLGEFDMVRTAYNLPRTNRPMVGCSDCR